MKHGVAEFSDGKIMRVWDGAPWLGCHNNPLSGTVRVVIIAPSGRCLDDCGVWWDHCAPIPEKKMRPMTRDEMVIKICNSDKMAIRWRCGKWHPKAFHGISGDLSEYEWCDTSSGTFGPPQKFEVEE